MDYSKYPDNWRDTIRPAALKRAAYKCQRCGIRHRSTGYREANGTFVECDKFMLEWAARNGVKTFTVYLQIAHLDHDPMNCSDDNLRALCPRCHAINDKEIRSLRKITKFR